MSRSERLRQPVGYSASVLAVGPGDVGTGIPYSCQLVHKLTRTKPDEGDFHLASSVFGAGAEGNEAVRALKVCENLWTQP